MNAFIINAVTAGARYRAVPYSDISKKGTPVVGYGLSEKLPGARTYRMVAWFGQLTPWKTLQEARAVTNLLNQMAQAGASERLIALKHFNDTVESITDQMPGGPAGFLKTWGVSQMARKILRVYAPHLQIEAQEKT